MADGLGLVGSDSQLAKSHLHYRANDNFGGPQTYTVTMVDRDGRPFIISDSYSYDFKHSSKNENYKKAVNGLSTNRMKNFWSLGGLLDRQILQGSFDAYERTQNDRSLVPIINGIKNILYNTSPGAPPEFIEQFGSPLTKKETDEFMYMLESFYGLGWK